MGLRELAVDSPAEASAPTAWSADPLRDPLVDPLSAPEAEAGDDEAVQMKGGDGKAGVKALAAQGLKGSGGGLPHAARIQAAFGHHSLAGVTAHTDDKAAAATEALGAKAYASGSKIAFAPDGQDLHTAAHEAAHIIQQRAGLKPPGGVGTPGDPLEQHAEEVAFAVEAGDDDGAVQALDRLVGK